MRNPRVVFRISREGAQGAAVPFFFQGEDGIRGSSVTGVQTCALPILLVFCLDHILRLLHPFMPFITEEIWQKLPLVRTVDSLMIAPFPTPDDRLADPEAEQEMTPLIEVIEGIRTLRVENNLPPSSNVPALIISPKPRIHQTLQNWSHYLIALAGVGRLQRREI